MHYTQRLDTYLAAPSGKRAQYTPKAAHQFRHYVTRFITEACITTESGADLATAIVGWLNDQDFKSSTRNWVHGQLVQFFLVDGRLSYENVGAIKKAPRTTQTTYSGYTLNDEEIGRIIRFFATRPSTHGNATDHASLRNAAGVCILALTGIRISQLTSLRFDEVAYSPELQRMTVHVERQKNVEQTTKPIEFSTAKSFDGLSASVILDAYMTAREERYHLSDYLFCNEQYGKLSEEYWRKCLRLASDKLGIERCNPHAFRAYLATEVATKHGLLAAAQVLDHTNINTTMRYIQEVRSTFEYLS